MYEIMVVANTYVGMRFGDQYAVVDMVMCLLKTGRDANQVSAYTHGCSIFE